jgi:hypothetical protein
VSSFPDEVLENINLRNKNIHTKYTIHPSRKTIAIITKFWKIWSGKEKFLYNHPSEYN